MINTSKNTVGPEVVTDLLEAVIRRDRLIVMVGLGLVMMLAWGWLIFGAGFPTGQETVNEHARHAWNGGHGCSGGLELVLCWSDGVHVVDVI